MNIRTYTTGFALSLILTAAAFWLVYARPLGADLMAAALVLLALLQLIVQVVCFLHLGRERTHWNAIALAFAAFVILILVGGTLWIMAHLTHNAHDLSEIYEGGEIAPHTQHD